MACRNALRQTAANRRGLLTLASRAIGVIVLWGCERELLRESAAGIQHLELVTGFDIYCPILCDPFSCISRHFSFQPDTVAPYPGVGAKVLAKQDEPLARYQSAGDYWDHGACPCFVV